MNLSSNEFNESYLKALGKEAAELLQFGQFAVLAERFGYAIAFEREPASAIEADYLASLAEGPENHLRHLEVGPVVTVKYFAANSSGLLAHIECVVPVEGVNKVLLELVVTEAKNAKYVCIEQISSAA